ncbi:glycosyltransferase [Pantoea ananatis]|uniref:glycosyltransferase family 2 protein n=1 Tax=Pantoea ananas TaxID=553 RepID=UPI00352A994E
MDDNALPIVIMTRNDDEFLELCIESIINNTLHPYFIYIIDNSSNSPIQNALLDKYSTYKNIEIFKNKSNLWVLGVNEHLKKIKESHNSNYFLLTDGDIEFPSLNENKECWLTVLVKYMEQYKCIGKLGMSLDWADIENDMYFENILSQEKALYDEKRKIGELFISPVDTTAALYRWDWSINSFGLYPDHIRYLRPELYSCRTPRTLRAVHHGWKTYKENSSKNVEDKIKCFTLMGADIKKNQIESVGFNVRLYNKILAKPMKVFWGIRRRFYLAKYLFCKGLRKFDNH